jgi:hypothetical protein
MKSSTIRKLSSVLTASVVVVSAGMIATASPAGAAGTCDFTSTLCMWDQTGFSGATLNVTPLPPNQTACVDLVAHGWGNRVRSAVNTSNGTASLFESTDCTGRPYPISGHTSQSSITFGARSVWVQK